MTTSVIIPLLVGSYLISKIRPGQLTGEVVYVKSEIDGKEYLVQNKNDKKKSADILAEINKRLTRLVKDLKERRTEYPEFNNAISLLSLRFNGDSITEGNLNYDYTTYTLNKGQEINFCLRTRDESDNLHDLNLLMFVAIHELGHIASKQNDPNHKTEEFNKNFTFLLKRAVDLGIYSYTDYSVSPVQYCGTTVNSSPKI